jgi:hypothetical protein
MAWSAILLENPAEGTVFLIQRVDETEPINIPKIWIGVDGPSTTMRPDLKAISMIPKIIRNRENFLNAIDTSGLSSPGWCQIHPQASLRTTRDSSQKWRVLRTSLIPSIFGQKAVGSAICPAVSIS